MKETLLWKEFLKDEYNTIYRYLKCLGKVLKQIKPMDCNEKINLVCESWNTEVYNLFRQNQQ